MLQKWDNEMVLMQSLNVMEKISLIIGILKGIIIHNIIINAYILLFGSIAGIIVSGIMAGMSMEYLVENKRYIFARGYAVFMGLSLIMNVLFISGVINTGGLL